MSDKFVVPIRVSEATNSRYAIHALDWIFQYPIFSSNHFARDAEIPVATARRILSALISNNVLKTLRNSSGRRPAILMFQDVLDIVERRASGVNTG